MENITQPEQYTCPICLQYSNQPIQSLCCRHIFCKKCYQNNSNKLSKCCYCRNSNPQIKVRQDINQILNQISTSCTNEGCKQEIKRRNIVTHTKKQCQYLTVNCDYCAQIKIKKMDYLTHLIQEHKKQFQIFLVSEMKTIKQNDKKLKNALKKYWNYSFDPLVQTLNKAGRLAKRGNLNRYYCKASLQFDCYCDGYCGPNNGCNCVDCMQLTLQMNGVTQPNCLVNGVGNICKVVNNIPYCGIRIQYNTDIYCDLNHQCQNCQQLVNHSIERYRRLLSS